MAYSCSRLLLLLLPMAPLFSFVVYSVIQNVWVFLLQPWRLLCCL